MEDPPVVGQQVADEAAVHEIFDAESGGQFVVDELLRQFQRRSERVAVEREAVGGIVVEEHLFSDDVRCFARPVLLQARIAAREGEQIVGGVLVVRVVVGLAARVADEIVAQLSLLLDQQAESREIRFVELDAERIDLGVARRIAVNLINSGYARRFDLAQPVEVLGRRVELTVDDPFVRKVVHVLVNHIGRDLQPVVEFDLVGPVRYEQRRVVLRIVDCRQSRFVSSP